VTDQDEPSQVYWKPKLHSIQNTVLIFRL
jgi:hypothetical protein